MKEWTVEEWKSEVEKHSKTAFYLYTPMCGTCAVASKMMEVTEQLVPHLPIGKANLNFTGTLPYDLQIESVPCLVVTEDGEVKNKVYAFQSVPYLYNLLKKD
jgi:thioredoxin 1